MGKWTGLLAAAALPLVLLAVIKKVAPSVGKYL